MIRLRALKVEDAEHMLEFVNDTEIAKNFMFTRVPFSKQKFEEFIQKSWGDSNNIHYAITDESDEYMGTISLKNVNYIDRNAEYAIAIRRKFWGNGAAHEGTRQIIEYGFKRLNLHKIYLNVLSINARANRFYLKCGFEKTSIFKEHIYVYGKFEDLIWYEIKNESSEA